MSAVPGPAAPVFAADDEQVEIAQLASLVERQAAGTVRLVSREGVEVELPAAALSVLREAMHVLARGDAVAVITVHKDLTTRQAADLLNISRQYLVRLLERGEIPYHKVGTHRRLALRDVLAYRRQREADRSAALDELDRMSQEAGQYT